MLTHVANIPAVPAPSRWLQEPVSASRQVESVLDTIEEALARGGEFVGGPFVTTRGIGVLLRDPAGFILECWEPDRSRPTVELPPFTRRTALD